MLHDQDDGAGRRSPASSGRGSDLTQPLRVVGGRKSRTIVNAGTAGGNREPGVATRSPIRSPRSGSSAMLQAEDRGGGPKADWKVERQRPERRQRDPGQVDEGRQRRRQRSAPSGPVRRRGAAPARPPAGYEQQRRVSRGPLNGAILRPMRYRSPAAASPTGAWARSTQTPTTSATGSAAATVAARIIHSPVIPTAQRPRLIRPLFLFRSNAQRAARGRRETTARL